MSQLCLALSKTQLWAQTDTVTATKGGKYNSISSFLWVISINLTCDFLIKYKLRRHFEAERMSIRLSKWSVKQRSVLEAVHISAGEKNKMLCPGSYKEWSVIFRENTQNKTPQTSIATINARYQDKVFQYLLLNWVIHPYCALLIRALGDPGKWTICGLKESGK